MDRLTQNYDLFAVLLNTLRVLLANHNATNSDINFPAQLLITGMTTTVAKLKVSRLICLSYDLPLLTKTTCLL